MNFGSQTSKCIVHHPVSHALSSTSSFGGLEWISDGTDILVQLTCQLSSAIDSSTVQDLAASDLFSLG